MEFIKLNKNRYLIKDSNNLVVSEEEMLKFQKKELIIKDIQSNECQGKTTQKIMEINEKLNEQSSKPTTVKKTKKPIR